MKLFKLLSICALAVFFTSCLEENIVIEDGGFIEFPDNPVNLNRIDANEMAGLKFSMARIELNGKDQERTLFMPSCELSILGATNEAGANSWIDESDFSYSFTNDIQPDARNAEDNTISFAKDESIANDRDMSGFLENNVFSLIGGNYPLEVSRVNNQIILTCENCPITYEEVDFNSRKIRLTIIE